LLENGNNSDGYLAADNDVVSEKLNSTSDNDDNIRLSSSSTASLPPMHPEPQLDFQQLSSKLSQKQIYPELEIIDYGGQRVFDDLCNIFLPSRAYYIVCFSLKWFEEKSTEAWTVALFHLKYWINSIISHVMQHGLTQQIFLVGTHANSLKTENEEARLNLLSNIHTQICDIFTSTVPHVKYSKDYCFFPIDNTKGKACKGIIELRASLESAFTFNELRTKVKLSWCHAIDMLKMTKSSILEMKHAQELLKNVIDNEELFPFLQYCENEGIFLCTKSNNDYNSYEKIILDPVTYFMEPASLIICQHKEYSTSSPVSRHHNNYVHHNCRTEHPLEWKTFVEEGILSVEMLNQILSKYSNDDRKNITNFMISTNLLIPVYSQYDKLIQKYFIPSLLLNQTAFFNSLTSPQLKSASGTVLFVTKAKFYVYVTLYPNAECRTIDQMKRNGFLPNTFFNKLISRLISSDFSEDGTINSTEHRIQGQMLKVLNETQVLLSFGNQRIRLTNHFMKNFIEIEIEGFNPSIVEKEIRNISTDLCCTFFQKKLFFQTLFNCPADILTEGKPRQSGEVFISCDSFLINRSLPQVNTCLINSTKGVFSDGILINNGTQKAFLNKDELKISFHLWLQHELPRNQHDYFLSYRQQSENLFVQQIFDKFQHYSFRKKERGYHVFKDSYQLQVGDPLKETLIQHLINSIVFVPFISSGALTKVADYSLNNEIDHVLLEWIVAMILFKFRDKVLPVADERKILLTSIIPVFIGSIDSTTQVMNNLFNENNFKSCLGMTEIIPERELQCALSVLNSKQVKFSSEIEREINQWSIGKILSEYQNILVITSWDFNKETTENTYDEKANIINIISVLLDKFEVCYDLALPSKPDNAIWRIINVVGSIIKSSHNKRHIPLEKTKLTLGSVVLAGVVIGSQLLR
jgi:hypothetical protein